MLPAASANDGQDEQPEPGRALTHDTSVMDVPDVPDVPDVQVLALAPPAPLADALATTPATAASPVRGG